jgi:hypothetical protein
MSPRKPRYTLDQHDMLGLELQTIRDRLVRIEAELGKAYPLKLAGKAGKVVAAVDELRSSMDEQVFKEYPSITNIKPTQIYYRASRPDHVRDPRPILPLREVSREIFRQDS